MRRLVLLHTNDIHGNVDGIGRVATLVEQIAAAERAPVLYVDAGDVEETTSRLSNVTKGAAMHRLMSAAGCRAMTVGNASWFRYGPQVLPEHAANASYPLLCANLRAPGGAQLAGTQDTCVLDADGIAVGLIGVTAPFEDMPFFDVEVVSAPQVVREHAAELRALGAEIVVVLSHLGWDNPVAGLYGDRDLAVDVAGEVDVIVGAHSHSLLPHGETVAGVPVAQAGDHAHHLGRIDFVLDRSARVERISVLQVPGETRLHPRVAAAVAAVEAEVETYLSEIVGELADPLEYAEDRECSTANFMADVLRERTRADVALMGGTHAITASLPAGSLRRGTLWDACDSSGNPGVVALTGEQLRRVVKRGLDADLVVGTPRPLRGRPRGLLHVSGAEVRDGELLVDGSPVARNRTYTVAGSDFELEPYGGWVPAEWNLRVRYELPTIMREAVEDHLRRSGPVRAPAPRIHGRL